MVTKASPKVDFFGNRHTYIWMTDAELAEIIGGNVRSARLAAGLTQDELSEKTGIAKPHISRLEKGTHLPSVSTLKKVSDALSISICALIESQNQK